jgi:hypothetical protein
MLGGCLLGGKKEQRKWKYLVTMLLPAGSLATPRSGREAVDLVENQRNPAVGQQHVHQDRGMVRALLLPSARSMRSIVISAPDFHIILKSLAHKTKCFRLFIYLLAEVALVELT